MQNKRSTPLLCTASQHGVVLLFALIVMTILMIGAAAVVKSMNAAMSNAGNIAFRRDMVNQGELVLQSILKDMDRGGRLFSVEATTTPSLNYSAVALPVNSEGIPLALLDEADETGAFAQVGRASNDITSSSAGYSTLASAMTGTKIRYVIDRLCERAEPASPLHCVQAVTAPPGGTAGVSRPTTASSTIYRINVRVSGPRNTQVFLQASLNKPGCVPTSARTCT